MTSKFSVIAALSAAAFAIPLAVSAQDNSTEARGRTRLAIVWTSGDPEVAHRMVLMYAHAAKQNNWFDDVRLVVWGPSARLLAADKDVQSKVAEMKRDGVDVKACVVCADSYGVTKHLRNLDIEVLPMGKPLSDMLHDKWTVLTF